MGPRTSVLLALIASVAACKSPPEPARGSASSAGPPASSTPSGASAAASAPPPSTAPHIIPGPLPSAKAGRTGHLDFIAGPPGDVRLIVLAASRAAATRGHRLLLYSCTPKSDLCGRFKGAALSGDLDGSIPAVTFIEFDGEDDHDRLAAAGYTSQVMPSFVVPAADGRASPQVVEGGATGKAVISFLAMRLQRLLMSATPP
jgi:hypothetical protein